MDCSHSAQSPSLNDSDEPLIPQRSPSRLDFCMEHLEDGDNSPMCKSNWSCTSFRDDCPYTFIDEEDPSTLDIAPLAHRRLLIEDPIADPPQATGSHAHENKDTPPPFFAPSEDVDEVVIGPQAPKPVRPSSVQIQADTQESMSPPRAPPEKLNYPHHGFSYSALLQQKILWNSRREEWAEWQSRMEWCEGQKQESDANNAYTGIATHPSVVMSPPPYMRGPPSGLERDLASQPQRKHTQDVHASIYPRVGDISALRDPYSVNIDRSFFRFPLWTLRKMLYALDMQRKSASIAPTMSVYNTTPVQVSTSSSTLSSYSSSTSGDDDESDTTLVVDDSPVPESQCPLEPLKNAPSSHSSPSWNKFSGWDLSWYARWELLIGIFQRGHTRYSVLDHPVNLAMPHEPKASLSPLPRQIFRFTIGATEDDNEIDEGDNFGTPVADSSFSADFDEECERALAFYNRELERPEVVL